MSNAIISNTKSHKYQIALLIFFTLRQNDAYKYYIFMKTYKLTLLIAFLGIATLGEAQNSWKLEDCIGHALQNNIQIKRSELQEKRANINLTQSAFEASPTLSAYYNHQYLNGTTFSQYELEFVRIENQGGSLGINSELTIFRGLQGYNNRARLKYDLLSQRENTEILKNDITLSVVAKFLQVLLDSESKRLAVEQAKLSEEHLQKAETELELGRISHANFLTLKSQHVLNKSIDTDATNKLRYSTIELAQLLEIENPEDFSIKITPIIISDNIKNINNLLTYSQIAEHRPEIKKAQFDTKSAQKNIHMAYGLLSPRVSIGYTFGSGYDQSAWYGPVENRIAYPDYTYTQQIKDYSQHILQFRVSVPIFNKFSTFTRISESKIDFLDAKYALEEAEKQVYKEVQMALSDSQAAWDKYLAYTETAASYRELYEQTSRKFELGMVNALEVGVAQNNLIKAEGELLHAKYTYLLKIKILDFYKGVPITL